MQQPRIVFWQAVSSEEQATDKFSLEYQRQRNAEHAAHWNGVIIDELVVDESRNIVLWEEACSAIEAYAKLDNLIKRRAFDILMCMDATRLGRTRAIITTLVSLCERANIRVYETSSPPLTIEGPVATADMQLLMLFKSHQSEQEVKKFTERSLFGRQARAKKGKHAGNPPYGYQRVYDALGTSSAVIDEEASKVVLLFYDLYLVHGRSLTAICEEFTTLGYVSPHSKRPWVPGTLRQMLKNRWAYAGYLTWGQLSKHTKPEEIFRVKAEWPPLITEDMAREAERQLNLRVLAPRSIKGPYRFSMIARCAVCGGNVIVKNHAGKSGCITNRYGCHNGCRGGSTGDPEMMAYLRKIVTSLSDHQYLYSLIDETPDYYQSMKAQHEQVLGTMEEVRSERKQLTLAFTRKTIGFDEYDEIMGELQERFDDLAYTAAQLEQSIATTPTAEARLKTLTEIRDQGLAMLDHSDNRTCNTWLRKHFILWVRNHEIVAHEIY